MREQIYFAKVRPDAIIPSKEEENAGMDIYANFPEDNFTLNPHETKMIPTGIASSCSKDYYFQLFERGSTGTKGMAQRCGVIDSGYRFEWFVPLTNTTNKILHISKLVDKFEEYDANIYYPYSKAIAQVVILPVPKTIILELPYDVLSTIKSDRGMGSLGSTNK